MSVWTVRSNNGEGCQWDAVYGSRKEALEEGKRLEVEVELKRQSIRQEDIWPNCGYYTITKENYYYNGA